MIDVNKPVENPELVKAIEDYQQAPSTGTEDALLKALPAANYLVVLDKPLNLENVDENGRGILKEKQQIGIPILESTEGNFFCFGFTDWQELVKWSQKPPAETATLITPFSDMAAMVLDERTNYAGFVINPASHNQVLTKQVVAALAGKPAPSAGQAYTVKKDTRVMLGTPKEYPEKMVEAISAAAKPLKLIKRLYLLLMCKEDGEQSFLLVVEGKGDVRTTFDTLGRAAGALLPQGMFLDIVPAGERFGQDAIRNQTPFYKRGLF